MTRDYDDDAPVHDDETSHALVLIASGGELAGAVVGAAIGLVGGPVFILGGAAAGVAVTRAIKHAGAEFHRRVLAPREEQRIGATLAQIVVETNDIVVNGGEQIRADGFFDPGDSERSDADELLEAVLQRAARTYQERKLPYISRLWPSVAVSADITASYAQLLAQLADDLTYDELVALALIQNAEDPIWGQKLLADIAVAGGPPPRAPDGVAVLDRLSSLGLVEARDPSAGEGSRDAVMPIYRFFASGFRDMGLRQAVLTQLGARLSRVLGLGALPVDEQERFLDRLSYGLSLGPDKFRNPLSEA